MSASEAMRTANSFAESFGAFAMSAVLAAWTGAALPIIGIGYAAPKLGLLTARGSCRS
jgi:hypothetical protein